MREILRPLIDRKKIMQHGFDSNERFHDAESAGSVTHRLVGRLGQLPQVWSNFKVKNDEDLRAAPL